MNAYLVDVLYREPTYERQHGARAEPYRFRYRLMAEDAQRATELVRLEFEHMNAVSAVGWTREITSIVVVALG